MRVATELRAWAPQSASSFLLVDGSLKGLRRALNFATGPESACGASSGVKGCAAAAELARAFTLPVRLDTSRMHRRVKAGGL